MSPKLKLVLGLIAIFLAGFVVGGSVGLSIGKSRIPAPKQQTQRSDHGDRDRERDRGSFTDRMCSRLKKDLDLTEEQGALIRPIVEETSVDVKRLNAENYDRVREIFTASHQKMKPFLTPEQVQKLDEKDRERAEKAKKAGVKPPC